MKRYHIIKPDFYDHFSCKGSDCRYTCCQGWSITLTKEEYRRINSKTQISAEQEAEHGTEQGEEKEAEQGIEQGAEKEAEQGTEQGTEQGAEKEAEHGTEQGAEQEAEQGTEQGADQKNNRHFRKLPPEHRKRNMDSVIVLNEESECPFLSQNRLCKLQCEYGEGILPSTCSRFPRSNHLYLADTIQSLSPGCERVLELSFRNRKIRLIEEDRLLDILPYRTELTRSMAARYPTLKYYKDILSLCLILLQAEDTILENRLLLLGIAIRHIEELGAQGESEEIPGYISQYLSLLDSAGDIEGLLPKIEMNPLALLHNLMMAQQFQATSDREVKKMLSRIYRALNLKITQDGMEGQISFSSKSYLLLKEQYQTFLAGREHFMENLMVTFLLYMNLPFCPAISVSLWDNYMCIAWTYSIVKLCLTACMGDIRSEGDFIHYCTILMRSWAHSTTYSKKIVKSFTDNECGTLAHIATLLYS